ncbi:Outer membrane lipoprotein Blc precursor [Vibrio aerogenes CECT 7868]|uniref:Outer membrane lipoprotein Blc n=1 Tax=Vibrio aerogenes CECT 7868 TaxID=1216006 RepID=A0A1M6DR16_9VIBR|nr:lipocalin family protein [Vibrio aerogenes]SHI75704.1 Outer membrane lipoprotein Blc precursor [Vibrio aerogenes CECT 7868]
MKHFFWWVICLLCGCTGMPDSVNPVQGFDLNRYLGTWYEIARLDHSFEKGLEKVTATYRLRDDGGVSVLNKGYSPEKNVWNEAEGRAYFVQSADIGYLKVSFFGPFFGSYIVFGLDHEQYQYAFVSGPDLSYLWLLSRTPHISPEVKQAFVKKSQQLGFDTSKLIWVQQ